jgi:NodT family efflux transporter outer membrane factor (OMF) lipoprotein
MYRPGPDRCVQTPVAYTSQRSVLFGCFVGLLVGSCAVGPDFKVPPAPEIEGYTAGRLPKQTVSSDTAGGASQSFDMGRDLPGEWWALFRSRHLNSEIERAITANANLQAAQATLRQAQENAKAQLGSLFPQLDANGSATREQFSPAQFGQSGPPFTFNLFNTTVNVSYAIDVFGGKRRAVEASEAQAENQRFQYEATFLTLTGNVVTTAIQEASLRGQIKATQDIIKDESQQLEVLQRQFELGGASRADVLAQEAELAATQATLPPLQKQLEQERNLLATLTGRFPSEAELQAFTLVGLRLPRKLPVSLPSQLVEQRPDIRSASAQLHQASAQVGVAIANMLPQFNITGDYGAASLQTATLFTPQSVVWSLGASATQPIFHGGTLIHQERAAQAAYEAAAAQYRDTVLNAFRNVADSLRAIQHDAVALQAQERAVRTASESLTIAREQFRAGAITYLTLLNAERTYEQAQIGLVQAQAARYADTAALFQALGGGWWNRKAVTPNEDSTTARAEGSPAAVNQ